MKVLFVSKYVRTGGASIAAYRLMQALRAHSVDARMLVQQESAGDDPSVTATTGTLIGKLVGLLRFLIERSIFILHERSRTVRFLFSLANTGERITGSEHFREADIIHLHWINGGYLSLRSIGKVLKSGKPVVWTFHDMWAFTGGCHYALDCKGYLHQCGNCPYLKRPHAGDLSNRVWRRKRKVFRGQDFTVVTSSAWLGACARSSSLLGGHVIRNIPIPVDQELFRPLPREEACSRIGLDPGKKYILFGAANVRNMLKGLDYFLEAITMLYRETGGDEQMEVILLGKSPAGLTGSVPFRTHQMFYTGSWQKIVDVYNAAHLFVIPSLQDNLPNTVIESLSCGTPVVAFSTGGIPEMIDHRISGYLAEYKSSVDLCAGMEWVLKSAEYKQLSVNARQKAELCFSREASAGQYAALYREMLEERKERVESRVEANMIR